MDSNEFVSAAGAKALGREFGRNVTDKNLRGLRISGLVATLPLGRTGKFRYSATDLATAFRLPVLVDGIYTDEMGKRWHCESSACRLVGTTWRTLRRWCEKCPYGKPLDFFDSQLTRRGGGTASRLYAEVQLLEIAQLSPKLRREATPISPGLAGAMDRPILSLTEASAIYGWSLRALQRYKSRCPYLNGRPLRPAIRPTIVRSFRSSGFKLRSGVWRSECDEAQKHERRGTCAPSGFVRCIDAAAELRVPLTSYLRFCESMAVCTPTYFARTKSGPWKEQLHLSERDVERMQTAFGSRYVQPAQQDSATTLKRKRKGGRKAKHVHFYNWYRQTKRANAKLTPAAAVDQHARIFPDQSRPTADYLRVVLSRRRALSN